MAYRLLCSTSGQWLTWRMLRSPSIPDRSHFTATQAAAALRPFYFAVHPDLFGLHPEMGRTNEQSLKALNGYIDGLYTDGKMTTMHVPKPVSLKFYVRERKQKQKKLKDPTIKSVELRLKERDPCAAVRKILESCDLPTAHLPQPVRLPWRSADLDEENARPGPTAEQATDEELMQFWASRKKKRPLESDSLRNWLLKMSEPARQLKAEHDAMELDMKHKIDEIKDETGLTDIDFNLSWTLTHCRGCLQLFRKALTTSAVPVVNLRGWIIRFVRHGTYVSLDRSVVLGVDDLPSHWMSLVTSLNPPQAYYSDLPRLEMRLSELLGDATISGHWETPVRDYKTRLTVLINRLSTDRYAKRVDKHEWSQLNLIIENEACWLMLMENGGISVPYTISPHSLYQFIDGNHQSAIDLMEQYREMNEELKSLRRHCVQKWQLEAIDWNDTGGLSQHAIRTCLQRILSIRESDHDRVEEMKSILKGHRLHIGPQESFILLPDGRLSIPCDWKL